jgi:hypothetical protein
MRYRDLLNFAGTLKQEVVVVPVKAACYIGADFLRLHKIERRILNRFNFTRGDAVLIERRKFRRPNLQNCAEHAVFAF